MAKNTNSKNLPVPIEGKKVGRPLAKIDQDVVFRLAAIGLKVEEIAAACGVSTQTIYTRFLDVINEARASKSIKVKSLNYTEAMSGNDRALERELKMGGHLSDENTTTIQVNIGQQTDDMSDDDLLNIIEGEVE